jgi:hypothetical protein
VQTGAASTRRSRYCRPDSIGCILALRASGNPVGRQWRIESVVHLVVYAQKGSECS